MLCCPLQISAQGSRIVCETVFISGRSLLNRLEAIACLTSSNKKLVETSATLVVTGALLVVTRS